MRTTFLTIGTLLLAYHLHAQDSPITVADTSQQGPPFTTAAKGRERPPKKKSKNTKGTRSTSIEIKSYSGYGNELTDVFPVTDASGDYSATCISSSGIQPPISLANLASWRIAFTNNAPDHFEIRSVGRKNKEIHVDVLNAPSSTQPVVSGSSASIFVPMNSLNTVMVYTTTDTSPPLSSMNMYTINDLTVHFCKKGVCNPGGTDPCK